MEQATESDDHPRFHSRCLGSKLCGSEILGGDGKVGVGERIAVPRLVVAAAQLVPDVAEGRVDGAVRLPVEVLKDFLPRPRDRPDQRRHLGRHFVLRRVVLMLRETPLHAGHIDLMARATANGAIIMPPVPAFYALPRSLDELVDQTVSRALELLDVVIPGIKRWDGSSVVPDPS